MSAEGGADTVGMTSVVTTKKPRIKGTPHELHYDILDDPNIKAEGRWEEEEAEFWSSKMCKKYVKMYHIDKLWPRESHKRHTLDFCCKPHTCNNPHFVHRAEEVWRALFGNKTRSKGYINYSVASMVYAELILGKKVDWSTFPMTSHAPLQLGRDQKDIPDLYKHTTQPTTVLINTTTPTTKGKEVAIDAVHLSSMQAPIKESNASLVGVEGDVFLTLATDLTSTPNVTTVVAENNVAKKSDLGKECGPRSLTVEEVGDEDILMANTTIDDLLKTNALDVLELGAQNSSLPKMSCPTICQTVERVEVPPPQQKGKEHEDVEMNATVDDEEIKKKYPHLSTLNMSELLFLNQMPNAKELEELMEINSKWKAFFKEPIPPNVHDEPSSSSPPKFRTGFVDVAKTATELLLPAGVISEVAPRLREMAEEILSFSPVLLKGACAFAKFMEHLNVLLEEKKDYLKRVIWYEEELAKMTDQRDDFERQLEASKESFERKHSTVLALQQENKRLEKRIAELDQAGLAINDVNIPIGEQSQASSDKLSLPLEKEKAMEKSNILKADDVQDVHNCGVVVCTGINEARPTLVDNSMQTEGVELEKLKQELEEAIQEKVLVLSELKRLKQTMTMDEYLPSRGMELQWLAWVQKLQDRHSVVIAAMNGLKKHAMQSDQGCHAVMTSLEKFKNVVGQHPWGSIDITCWGDIDAMFERLNHAKKEEVTLINWALEAEEGWVPYDTFSAHVDKMERKVVHARDPTQGILEDHCCVCRGPFGPEGALIMGHCRHTFHVTCIMKASLHRSICPQCRRPLSARFYEMFGILEGMPPGHEYNRWTLPLDQGPYKFLNFKYWGKPLEWDPKAHTHGLNETSLQEVDPFVWMTKNRHIELRAREIDSDEARELFCRSMGGHWSVEHRKFFRFPEKEVQEGGDKKVKEVDHSKEFIDQYGTYNQALIGRALFLSKLEEAARVRFLVVEEEINALEPDTGHALVEVAGAFDRRMDTIITQWKEFLLEREEQGKLAIKSDDEAVNGMVDRVDCALRAFKAKEVDLSPARKRKRKLEEDDDDDYSPETRRRFSEVDMEVESGGRIVHPSQQRVTRQGAKLMAKEGPSRVSGEGSNRKK